MADDYAPAGGVEVWPDNWEAVCLFSDLTTQWRVGPGGPVGLDYAVLPAVLRMRGVGRKEWPDVFDCVRVMEGEALQAMREAING